MSDEYPWLVIAKGYLGQHEIPGTGANQFIVECLRDFTNVDRKMAESDETPWCSAFANRCVIEAGYEGTRSAWARSWLKWGQEVDWDSITPGAIVVLERGPTSGHVGFFMDADENRVQLLAGNQGDKVSLAWFPQDRIIGIRMPA